MSKKFISVSIAHANAVIDSIILRVAQMNVGDPTDYNETRINYGNLVGSLILRDMGFVDFCTKPIAHDVIATAQLELSDMLNANDYPALTALSYNSAFMYNFPSYFDTFGGSAYRDILESVREDEALVQLAFLFFMDIMIHRSNDPFMAGARLTGGDVGFHLDPVAVPSFAGLIDLMREYFFEDKGGPREQIRLIKELIIPSLNRVKVLKEEERGPALYESIISSIAITVANNFEIMTERMDYQIRMSYGPMIATMRQASQQLANSVHIKIKAEMIPKTQEESYKELMELIKSSREQLHKNLDAIEQTLATLDKALERQQKLTS